MPICTFIRPTGQRCKTKALRGEELCVFHSSSERGINGRAMGQYLRNCVNSVNETGRLRNLWKQFLSIRRSKSIATSEKVQLTLLLFEAIDKIERRMEERDRVENTQSLSNL